MRYRTPIWTVAAAVVLAASLTTAGVSQWDGVSGDAPAAPDFETPGVTEIFGPIFLVHGDRAFVGGVMRIDFDDAAHHAAVNDRYILQGVRFERDDAQRVHAYDFCACNNDTSSVPNVACTTRGPGAPAISNNLNLLFDADTFAVGFTLGNDSSRSMVFAVELFDGADRLIAAFPVIGNCNVDCDEFVGLTSLEPFRRVRISHNLRSRAVCIDDVVFSDRRMIVR